MDKFMLLHGIKKYMMRWFRGREYYAKNDASRIYSCYYYVESIKIEQGVILEYPIVRINVRVVKAYNNGRLITKPVRGMVMSVNKSLRWLILEDIRWDLSMFGITRHEYTIKVNNIKWGLG